MLGNCSRFLPNMGMPLCRDTRGNTTLYLINALSFRTIVGAMLGTSYVHYTHHVAVIVVLQRYV